MDHRFEVQPLRGFFLSGILCLTILVMISVVVLPSTSCAQTDEYNPAGNSVNFSFFVGTLYQFNAPVDGGGKLNIARYNAALDMSSRVSRDLRSGLRPNFPQVHSQDTYRCVWGCHFCQQDIYRGSGW